MGLVAVFAIARLALSSNTILTAGDVHSPAVVTLRGYIDAAIVVALAALLLTVFVVRTYYIASISMIPTLQIGDTILVDGLDYRLRAPAEGEVAVFLPPLRSATDFIKRVIGVPGDTIRIAGGTVYRNGKPLYEPYENQPASYDLDIHNYDIYVNGVPLDPARADIPPRSSWQAPDRIPRGYYFMLGDNRNYSADSHVWGFAKGSSFAGRAFMTLWPRNRVSLIRS